MRGSAAFRTAIAPGGVLAGPWVKNPLWRTARAVPSLDLPFADNKSLTDAVTGQSLVTFTRASSGTYVDSTGTLRTAVTNEARFDHNPTTLESLGLLVEEQRTNLLLYSDDFSNAWWTKTTASITSNVTTAPDGTTTADKWILDNGVTTAGSLLSTNVTKAASATAYVFTLFVKASEFSTLRFYARDAASSANRVEVTFNISTLSTSGEATAGTFSARSFSYQAFPNGWYRCSLGFTTGTETSFNVRITGTSSETGNGTSGLFVWGAQLEAAAFPTSYIPTTTAAATRSADVASITGSAFSSWYRQDEGTFFTSQKTLATNTQQGAYWFSASLIAARGIAATIDTRDIAQRLSVYIRDDISIGSLTISPLVDGDQQRIAHCWGTASQSASLNGLLNSGSYNAIYPGIANLSIGYNEISSGSPQYLSGTIKRLAYFPTRLPNNILQALTQ